MTKSTGVIEETKIITDVLEITVLPPDKGLEFKLKNDEYVLLNFENPRTFNCRWALLHKGSNKLMFHDVKTKTNVEIFRESTDTPGFKAEKLIIPPIPPPPGYVG